MSEYGLSGGHHRAAPAPQYAAQPAPNVEWYSSTSASQQQYSNYAYDQSYASSSGAAYGTFEDEAPLLEELGIDIPAIISRTKSILTFRLSPADVDSLDLGGPLVYMAILGVAHLLVGKLHFGYILGWTVVGSALIWFVLSSVAGHDADGRNLDLYTCCCLLGYAQLPLVLHAVGALLLPRRSWASEAAAVAAVLWSSQTAARLFIHRASGLRGQLPVVLYPCLLLYTAFALLTLY